MVGGRITYLVRYLGSMQWCSRLAVGYVVCVSVRTYLSFENESNLVSYLADMGTLESIHSFIHLPSLNLRGPVYLLSVLHLI